MGFKRCSWDTDWIKNSHMYVPVLQTQQSIFHRPQWLPQILQKPLLKTCQLSDGNLETQLNATIVQLASLQLH